jgi:succinate dehydrogenase / fumarate reductase cytochrome b subunit
MSNTERPLSPHLSIYRWPVTMTLSILHRITGVAMSIGLILLAGWLVQAAAGPEQYQQVRTAMGSLPGRILLVLVGFAFFLHFCNGIRHLVWDLGYGFEKQQASASAWWVLALALALNTVYWLLVP